MTYQEQLVKKLKLHLKVAIGHFERIGLGGHPEVLGMKEVLQEASFFDGQLGTPYQVVDEIDLPGGPQKCTLKTAEYPHMKLPADTGKTVKITEATSDTMSEHPGDGKMHTVPEFKNSTRGFSHDYERCLHCDGTGNLEKQETTDDNADDQTNCDHCGGSGRISVPKIEVDYTSLELSMAKAIQAGSTRTYQEEVNRIVKEMYPGVKEQYPGAHAEIWISSITHWSDPTVHVPYTGPYDDMKCALATTMGAEEGNFAIIQHEKVEYIWNNGWKKTCNVPDHSEQCDCDGRTGGR